MHLTATVFIPPNARREEITVSDVTPDDALWFIDCKIKLSMEELHTGMRVIYADVGLKTPDGEPMECIVMSKVKTCQVMLSELRAQCEAALSVDKSND